jgi:NitT/TauT family transport system substrate-binding protein
MHLKPLLTAILAVGVAAMQPLASATAKETVTYAYQLDPTFDAAVWALKNGKVTSDTIEVELASLTIPALIQATLTKQYDVIQSDTIGVPRSAARGLNLVIMSTAIRYSQKGVGHNVYVRADSPYQSIPDLKGKKIGVPSLGSAGFHMLRMWIEEKYGVNADPSGGDFQFVETPPSGLITGLDAGRFDAGTMLYSQAYKAREDKSYRAVAVPARGMFELWGVQMVPSVNVAYPEKIAARPAAFKEFNRLLRASVEYLKAHPDEVFGGVSAESKMSPDFFKIVFTDFAEIPADITDGDIKAIDKLWELAAKRGLLQSKPDVKAFLSADAVRN